MNDPAEIKSYPLECPNCGAALSGERPDCEACGFKFVQRILPVRKEFNLGRVLRFVITAFPILLCGAFWFLDHRLTLRSFMVFGGLLLVAYALSALPLNSRGKIEIRIKGPFDPEDEEMSSLDLLLLALGVLMVVATIFV